ncbi:MAG: CoA transferase [Burkholderiaceae bacterium]
MNQQQGPFAGMTVIDCASFIAGPAAATIMADFGADVIKIEPPEGDPYRGLWQFPGSPPATRNFAWDLDSRDKRSLVLDLKRPEGVQVLYRLVARADVFLTNLPLPVHDRLGIGHDLLLPLNPRLIYASLTAYGETGPEADKTGFDATAYWARSGLMDMIRPDAGSPPARAVAGVGDHPSATALYAAIVTALFQRERSGRGGHVSTSLMANGVWPTRCRSRSPGWCRVPPRPPRTQAPNPFGNPYRCRDDRWFQP